MFVQIAKRFRNDDRGAVAIIFGLLITSIFGMMALALDMGRAYSSNSRVLAALDAAALAGAKGLDGSMTEAQMKVAATAFFEQEMSKRDAWVTYTAPIVSVNTWDDTVSVSTTAKMATMFGGVIGKPEIDLSKAVTVTYRMRRVELSMALDITGSMNEEPGVPGVAATNPANSKLAALKVAAKEVMQTLFAQATADDRVRISLVPWAASVNAGVASAGFTSVAREASANVSTDQCVVERVGTNAATDGLPYGADASRAINDPTLLAYNCPTAPLVPLVDRTKQSQLATAIDAMSANGGTAGHIGTAWSWYTLSPAWASIWPQENRPRDYAPQDTIKSVLIMTDGEFNISWKSSTVYDPVVMGNESYAQFQALCSEMKKKNITVYTIGFGLTNARAVTEMKNCASGPAQFFQAVTGDDLKTAFQSVVGQLKQMRLTR